ncbi:hypothetical protein BC826DRAFT_1067442 [Russula brevipes]|nr:hypothetical protein BC826DRAFT_1067442 [Russula brevipes]
MWRPFLTSSKKVQRPRLGARHPCIAPQFSAYYNQTVSPAPSGVHNKGGDDASGHRKRYLSRLSFIRAPKWRSRGEALLAAVLNARTAGRPCDLVLRSYENTLRSHPSHLMGIHTHYRPALRLSCPPTFVVTALEHQADPSLLFPYLVSSLGPTHGLWARTRRYGPRAVLRVCVWVGHDRCARRAGSDDDRRSGLCCHRRYPGRPFR